MAKFTANGYHKVVAIKVTRPDASGDGSTVVMDMAIRSDGAVLWRLNRIIGLTGPTYDGGVLLGTSGYSILGKLKQGVPQTTDTLRKVARKYRYTPQD